MMVQFFLLFAAMLFVGLAAPAEAKRTDVHAAVPDNLEPIGGRCLRKQADTGNLCLGLVSPTEPRIEKQVRINRGMFRDKNSGEIFYGISHVTKNTPKEYEDAWLIEPKWARLHVLHADLAYGQMPGS